MSSKQIAYAAIHGRKVTFRFLAPRHEITGYVCGQDDYHWLVAYTEQTAGIGSDPSIHTVLVHKSSADLILLSPDSTLETEPPTVRLAVENVGRGFWAFCEKHYLNDGAEAPATSDVATARVHKSTTR